MRNYTDVYSNIINLVSENSLKHASDSLRQANCFGAETSQGEDHIFKNPNLTEMTKVETSLFCKNGTRLPHWFVSAYRAHRIPHEIADIVTQMYFISPPQVEEKPSPSCYLLVEPIIRTVYTMLWQSSQLRGRKQLSHGISDTASLSKGCFYESESKQFFSETANDLYDSDVIVEEDSEESQVDETEYEQNEQVKFSKVEDMEITMDNEIKMEKFSESEIINENIEMDAVMNANILNRKVRLTDEEIGSTVTENIKTKEDHSDESEVLLEHVESCDEELEADGDHSMKGCLKWYLRKGSRMWIKKVSHLSIGEAKALPSLDEIESLTLPEKKAVFYSVFNGNSQSASLELPEDLELILDFIIFWYQKSSSSLLDIHVLSALVCVFMFYLIDGKVGRIRTRKAFEDEEKWKSYFSTLQSDAAYCRPGDGLRDTLAQVSNEECLLAAHKLFKFHHMDQKVTDKYYSRKTVHAFSEYQACVYFVQLLNTLLGSPFPLLSIEHLWGGTFCYNIFFDLKKKPKPLMRVSELLGKGSCLEKLFYMLFTRLSEILKFRKYLGIVQLLENLKMPQNEENITDGVKVTVSSTLEGIPQKTKKRRKRGRKSNDFTSEKEKSSEERVSSEEKEMCCESETEPSEKEVDLLDNRFAGLLMNMHE